MRKLLWFTAGFACACLLAVYLLPEALLPWAAGLAALCLAGSGLALLLRGRRRPRRPRPAPLRRLLCASLGLAVGLPWCWGYAALRLAPARAAEGDYDTLTAELCDYPVQTWYGFRADGYVELPGGRFKTRFYLYQDGLALKPGDRIRGSFSLRRADRNADGETMLDLQAKGILLTASGRVEATQEGGSPLRYFPVRLSKGLFDRLGELLPADAAGLPQAMLTGRREGLSLAEQDALSNAGASHIIAVSGLHVSMLMGVLLLLTGKGRLSSLLGLPLLGLFVLMTGASPSVIRAALMLALLLLAPLFREESDPPSSLALAALLLLAWNPWTAANLSFQLSFAAVAGLLLVTPRLLRALSGLRPVKMLLRWKGPNSWPRRPRLTLLRLLRWVVRGTVASISASCGALIFTTPLTAAVFGKLAVYALLTNLAVLPLATICLIGTLAVLGLGLFGTVPGAAAGWLLAWPVRAIRLICTAISRLPGSLLYMDGYGLSFLLFAYGVLLLALLRREKHCLRPLGCLLTALAAVVLLQGLERSSADFTLAVLDVGQGQCVCMVTEELSVMTDCGGSGGPWAGRTAAAWLRKKGVTALDALILTHYDSDHICGVEALLTLVPVKTVYLPDVPFDPANRAAVERAALAAGAELVYVTEDRTLSAGQAQVRLFAPVSERNDNAACVCVLYSAGEYDMLITGDLDAAGEYALLEREELPPVELYVAGHHGSATSSTQALLDALRPQAVLISVGRNNYNLPNAEALARMLAGGAAVYRTDQQGNLETGR